MQTWTKYTYACDPDSCDNLIEVSTKENVTNITCPCGRVPHLLSVADATIRPIKQKEEKMETQEIAPVMYDANVLVTYKSIKNGEVSYPTIKVNQLEYELDKLNRLTEKVNSLQSQVNRIIDNLTEDYWFNPNTDTETILSDLCDILDHEPKKEINFTATFVVSGRYDIPLSEASDFDLDTFLADTMSIDAYNGDVVIDDWSLESVEEQY